MENEPVSYDPQRLRRASVRGVKRLGDRRYLVEGRLVPTYVVDLNDGDVPCTCADAQYRGRRTPCLHELAARLHDGDGALIVALGAMLLRAERAMLAVTFCVRATKPTSRPTKDLP